MDNQSEALKTAAVSVAKARQTRWWRLVKNRRLLEDAVLALIDAGRGEKSWVTETQVMSTQEPLRTDMPEFTLLQQLKQLRDDENVVDAIVMALYRRVLADGELAMFFQGIDMQKLERKMMLFLVAALNGETWKGPDLAKAHAGVQIREADFNRVKGHLEDALAECKIPNGMAVKIVDLVGTLKFKVVNTAGPAPEPAVFE